MKTRVGVGLAAAVLVMLSAAWLRPDPYLSGFTSARVAAHLDLEQRFIDLPSADRIRNAHRFLTERPHLAGSARDLELAEWMRDRFLEFGLDDVEIATHEVLLPWPEEVSVEMLGTPGWRASMREDGIPGDPYTHASIEEIGRAYHAYSASGEVTSQVVYAGNGDPADYDWLASQGIDVRGRIVLLRYSAPYRYRGFKALTAQQRGAAGILIYSDPADDGHGRGKVYPEGPWGPESHIQRGAIAYDFLVPGDPHTPGWASVPGARRIRSSEAVSLPRIVSAPLSHKDARAILDALAGPEVPKPWRGAMPLTYRAGPSARHVRLRVRSDDRVRPIWTVTAMIRGSEQPDDVVILGNHRDAWVYGGVDPSSGSAALVELARAMGALKRAGWRPKRSILFASWDAEEFMLGSSTEWGEQHAAWLRKHAVAYLNVDSAASGPDLDISAVPALNALIEEIALAVRDPASGLTLAARARDRAAREGGRQLGAPGDFIDNRLGGGSDYTVFLNFLGVPVADFSFTGPYGVYHSIYDNHNWVAAIGDPGFRYHVALVQLWGLVALRLADADVVPLAYDVYAQRIVDYAAEIGRRWTGPGAGEPGNPLDNVRGAATELAAAAIRFNRQRDGALGAGGSPRIERLNRALLAVERALTDAEGLPGRPWYKHLIYAPKFNYTPELLPGIAEAIDANDDRRARAQADRVAAGLRRAADALDRMPE
jgi:N-acetylated-alpha-linked acidic dipeptidase